MNATMNGVRQMNGFTTALNGLRDRGRMTWSEHEGAWLGAPEEILRALAEDGFDKGKRELTMGQRDAQPAGGMWQGVNPDTGSVASAMWITRPGSPAAMVFVHIDGSLVTRPGREPDDEEGGEA